MSGKEQALRESQHERMGSAPLLPLIIKMSLPAMFSMMIQALYNIVDSIYVSRLGESALAAVSLIFPVQLLISAAGMGLSVGLSSLISRRLGEKNIEEANAVASHDIVYATIFWIAFLLFGIFGSNAFANAFSDDPALIAPAADYCRIVCIGSLFIFNALQLEKIMQACSEMIAPMICQLVGTVLNIVLDPIMIFGYWGFPALGVAGAAYATIIGQIGTFIVSLILIKTKNLPVHIRLRGFRLNGKISRDIFSVALPNMVMQSISSFLTVSLNAILIGFSDTAFAVLGVYFKLQSFVFMPIYGMNQGIIPIMGYNYGEKNRKRLMDAYQISLVIALILLGTGFLVFKIFPDQLMGLFQAEGDMLAMGRSALRIISNGFLFAAISIITGSLFNATGHGLYMIISTLLRQFIVILPFAYFLTRSIGVDGVWWASVIAEVVSLIVTLLLFYRLWNRKLKLLSSEEAGNVSYQK